MRWTLDFPTNLGRTLVASLAFGLAACQGGVAPPVGAPSGVSGAATTATTDVGAHQRSLSKIYVARSNPTGIVGIRPASYLGGPKSKIKIPFGIAVDPAANELIVANEGGYRSRTHGSLVRLTASGGDNIPKSVIECKKYSFWGVTFDGQGNIVSGNLNTDEIFTFAREASGCVSPISHIGGAKTGIQTPLGVAYDHQGRLVVLNFNAGIEYFAPGASGNVEPVATIYGPQTGLVGSEGMALDRNDNVYAACYGDGTVVEFAAGSNGNVAPIRTIGGPHTGLKNPIAVAVDASGAIFVADYGANVVFVFAPDANGDVAPRKQFPIAGPTAIAVTP